MAIEGVWIRYKPDCRGWTDTFKCSNCGEIVQCELGKECEYPYCPWCRCEMVETEEDDHDD